MRPTFRRVGWPAVLAVALLLPGVACGGDNGSDTTPTGGDPVAPQGGPDVSLDDPGANPTGSDPGPNPTGSDPGPNPTSGGPLTVEGSLVLDDPTGCVTLETEDATLDLRLSGYSLGEDAGSPALADTEGQPVARPGDTVIVSGFERAEQSDCGTRFDVDSLNSVLPAA